MLATSRARTLLIALLAFALVMTLLIAADPYPKFPIRLPDAPGVNIALWLQLGLLITAGGGLIVVTLVALRRRDGHFEAMLLALWLLGTFAFAAALNWSVNGRSILAATPAVAIVAARQFERVRASRVRAVALIAVLCVGMTLSLLCVHADTAHARAARRAANELADRFAGRPRPLFFLGHWGFQYYLEARGGRALDPLANEIRGGDLFAQPLNNAYPLDVVPAAPNALPVVATFESPTCRFLATMDRSVAAGFYSDAWGPLPYGFGRVPPDRYLVRQIAGPVQVVPRE
jgi:hypothetical protein